MERKHAPAHARETNWKAGVSELRLPSDDAEIQLAAATLLGGVVFVDHALDPALRIAAGPLQILVRVGEFVLVKFQAALARSSCCVRASF